MFKSVGANWVVTLVTILVTYVLTPWTISRLGAGPYGLWLVITSLVSYLTLIRGGLPSASVRYLAEQVAADDQSRIDAAIASCMTLYFWLSAVAFLVGAGMFVFFEATYNDDPTLLFAARWAFVFAAVEASFGFMAHVPYAVLEAHDEFVTRNWIRLASVALRVVLTFGLLAVRPDLIALGVTLTVCTFFELFFGIWLVKRRFPKTRFGFRGWDSDLARKMVRYGAYVMLLSVGGRLAFKSDALVIGHFGSPEDVSIYSVANSLVLYLMEFLVAIAIVVAPKSTRLRNTGQTEELQKLFLQWTKISASLSQIVGLFLLFLGPAFLTWWINPEFGARGGAALQVLVLSFLFFLPIRGVGIPILMGVGNIAVPSMAFLALGVINVGLSILLVPRLGLLGAALGTAIPNVLFSGAVVFIVCRETGVAVGRFIEYTAVRVVIGSLPLAAYLAVCAWVLNVQGFFGLLFSGLGYLALAALVWLGFVFRGDEYTDVFSSRIGRKVLARLPARLRPGSA